jgi:hypothetical protein
MAKKYFYIRIIFSGCVTGTPDSQLLGSLWACDGAVVIFPVQMLIFFFSKKKSKSKILIKYV